MGNSRKFNNLYESKRILVAPLEWGLGHATRCIPLIRELLQNNCQILIAAEGATYSLLKNEFPDAVFLPLTGYRVKYSRKRYFLPVKILLQFPKIALAIFTEHKWLKKIVDEYSIDAVISDNRFGLYSKKIPCIYITHQLLIKTSNRLAEKIAQRLHYHFIRKYKECWVPDRPGVGHKSGLAGVLSHPENPPGNIKYIGPLSRFSPGDRAIKYDLLISVSGPEPQRTVFEKLILEQITEIKQKVLFVRGLPGEKENINSENPLIEIKNHLDAFGMNHAILQSEMVISRCGYTTVMDLVKLQKKAILIPTPGQTEQEYLADYLMQQKMFYTVEQKNFILQKELANSTWFPFDIPHFDMEQYKNVIATFVQSL